MTAVRCLGVTIVVCLVLSSGRSVRGDDNVAPGKGMISGVLVDQESSLPVPDTELILLQVDRTAGTDKVQLKLFLLAGKFPKVTTDRAGRFRFETLPMGVYAITSAPQGYEHLVRDDRGNPRAFELTRAKPVLDLGKIRLAGVK